jgi:hypothetical protein
MFPTPHFLKIDAVSIVLPLADGYRDKKNPTSMMDRESPALVRQESALSNLFIEDQSRPGVHSQFLPNW